MTKDKAVISAWSLREVYFDEDGEPSMHRSPPQRPWQGLTDEEIFHADPRIGTSDSNVNPYQILINARAIEAALRSKNT